MSILFKSQADALRLPKCLRPKPHEDRTKYNKNAANYIHQLPTGIVH